MSGSSLGTGPWYCVRLLEPRREGGGRTLKPKPELTPEDSARGVPQPSLSSRPYRHPSPHPASRTDVPKPPKRKSAPQPFFPLHSMLPQTHQKHSITRSPIRDLPQTSLHKLLRRTTIPLHALFLHLASCALLPARQDRGITMHDRGELSKDVGVRLRGVGVVPYCEFDD